MTITILSGLLTAFFLFASSIKILGWQNYIFKKQLEFFIKYGLNRTLMALVGCVELFGAIALWLPGHLGILGALVLLGTSAGAIFFHLRFDTWKDGIPAMVTLTLSAIVAYSKYNVLAASIT
ncbi:MAG: DoxX family protein [Candidatus Thiodiazotropha sp. (ex Codakia rugifera)]|nr:DoxX family protein [Candidatus Thiodiazotropha sp. (ex Codakia rugifera)]